MSRSRLVACATIAAALFSACTVGEPSHDHPLDLDSALLVPSRDRLAVCLQVDPALAPQAERLAAQLHADLLALRAAHPDWRVAGLDRGDVAVVVGCPGGALQVQTIGDKGTGGAVIGPGLRAAPTAFRTHVHVIADAAAATMLGDRPFARAIAELAVVDDHRVAEVSTALVVRASALGTAAFRHDALAQSVGLRVLAP